MISEKLILWWHLNFQQSTMCTRVNKKFQFKVALIGYLNVHPFYCVDAVLMLKKTHNLITCHV